MSAALALLTLALASSDPHALVNEGDRLLFDGEDRASDYQAALARYDAALATKALPPKATALVHARRAEALLRTADLGGDDDEKLRLYQAGQRAAEAGLALDEGCSDCWLWRGATMGRAGETRGILQSLFLLDDVKQCFTRALAADPKNAAAKLALGQIDRHVPGFAGGSKERAEAAFRAALAMEPRFSRARLDLAELLFEEDRPAEARALVQQVLDEKQPSRPGEHKKLDLPRARALLARYSR